MTLSEATRQGICRLRDPKWANPNAYVKIDIIEQNGKRFYGPWGHLYDRRTQELIGEPTPQDFLLMNLVNDDGVPYIGALDEADAAHREVSGE